MDGKYTRLKLKMLLLVVLGTLIAGGVGIFLLEVVVDGVLQDPFARFFLWAATTLFGQSPEGAAELYQRYIRNNKQEILTLGTMLLMLIAFYLAMGRFTRWLDDIRSATRRLVEAQAEPVELPRELAPIQEDLNAIQRQLRAREAAARESEQRKGDLVAFLAHDLKTPLTSVVGYLTLLRDDPGLDAAQRAKFTGIALDKARRLEELLGEFFDITRMDLDSGPGERQPIQLSMLLEQLADEFYPLFAEKQLRCTVEIQHHLVVLGDPDKLARVFDNVLRNAVSYSTPGGRVDIQAKTVGRQAEITIRNEGLEIPEGELANIFQKFYRLDAARSSRTGGAGLGLAIAKEIVESHGGNIRCESNGRLTSFVISLPLYKEVRHVFKRNRVVPDGAVNFAFLGQFAETERDTIFTTEYSMRTGMEAVYTLLDIDRGVPEVWGSTYDVRDLINASVQLRDGRKLTELGLNPAERLALKAVLKKLHGTDLEKLLQDYHAI